MNIHFLNSVITIDWHSVIIPGISILEKILRAVITYAFVIFGFRIFGKRELGQMTPLDMVVLFLLSNTVQNALIGNDNSLSGGIIGAAVLFVMNYLVVKFLYSNQTAEKIIEGTSTVLIDNGVVLTENLKREVITYTELETAAHKQGFGTLDEIVRSEIDPEGAITFIAKQPTPKEEQYQELLLRIDNLTQQVLSLKNQLEKNTADK